MRDCNRSAIEPTNLTFGLLKPQEIEQFNQTQSTCSIVDNSEVTPPAQCIGSCKKLRELFKLRSEKLCFDDVVTENWTIRVINASGANELATM